MADKEKQKIDWIYLPKNVEEISLWRCLHDGELISCKSNLQERLIELEVRVDYLLGDEEKQASIRFLLTLEDVTSVRAVAHFRGVEKFEEPENPEQREQLINDYRDKWREETVSWPEFESALDTDPLQISDGSFGSDGDTNTLRLGGFLDGEKFDDIFFDVFIRGKRLSVARSDGQDFNLDALIELGKNYWDNFGKRRRGE